MQTANLSSEEQMLDSVFRVCDSEERGKVSVSQIIDYLKSVTDPSRDGNRLQCLCTMLDPDNQGTLVDLQTFRRVMTKWIASCSQDRELRDTKDDELFMKNIRQPPTEKQFSSTAQLEGYGGLVYKYMGEPTDLVNKITDLNFTNKKLIDQKIKLQRSLELAEETNANLTEEISEIKSKLKSSQQAMHQVQSAHNELEDMKTFAKSLEDKIAVLCSQRKQLQKDTLLFSSQNQSLQDENDKLLSEKEKVKKKLDSVSAENFKLVHQLCEYENLLLQKDELLTQKTLKLEELQGLVEEHTFLLEELNIEKNRLEEQLSQTHEDLAIHSHLTQNQCSSILSAQSVCKELEEIPEWRLNPNFGLPNPLCGISGYINSLHPDMTAEDIWTEAELMLVQLKQELDLLLTNLHGFTSPGQSITSKLEEQRSILLQGLSCLAQLQCAWETYTSKINGAPQTNADNGMPLSPRSPIEWSLLPVNNQLTPHHRQNRMRHKPLSLLCTDGVCSFSHFTTRLRSNLTVPRILLMTLIYTFLFFPSWSGEHIWTIMAGILRPHLKLEHLSLPPI
ncbi:protein KASH5 [Mixophyes fleayi]|uniref:protein KASH5 n=1 Tax=Mixophyes fleayi TaxID=3061075 RepID=UPI003F4E1F4D